MGPEHPYTQVVALEARYPYWRKAIIDASRRRQTCAVCGDLIILEEAPHIMRFGTGPSGEVLALHQLCVEEPSE